MIERINMRCFLCTSSILKWLHLAENKIAHSLLEHFSKAHLTCHTNRPHHPWGTGPWEAALGAAAAAAVMDGSLQGLGTHSDPSRTWGSGWQFPKVELLYLCPQTLQLVPNPGYSQELFSQLCLPAGKGLAKLSLGAAGTETPPAQQLPGKGGKSADNKWTLGLTRQHGFLKCIFCAGCHKEATP